MLSALKTPISKLDVASKSPESLPAGVILEPVEKLEKLPVPFIANFNGVNWSVFDLYVIITLYIFLIKPTLPKSISLVTIDWLPWELIFALYFLNSTTVEVFSFPITKLLFQSFIKLV